MSQSQRIGELLVAAGLITTAALEESLAEQAKSGARLGDILVRRGLISEAALTQILSNQLSVAWVSLKHVEFPRELLSLIPSELALELTVIPVLFRMGERREKILYVAVDDPTNVPAMQRISEITGMHVRPLIAPASEIRRAIRAQYFGEDAG
jgi:type IV pilus assembly protein PilB